MRRATASELAISVSYRNLAKMVLAGPVIGLTYRIGELQQHDSINGKPPTKQLYERASSVRNTPRHAHMDTDSLRWDIWNGSIPCKIDLDISEDPAYEVVGPYYVSSVHSHFARGTYAELVPENRCRRPGYRISHSCSARYISSSNRTSQIRTSADLRMPGSSLRECR